MSSAAFSTTPRLFVETVLDSGAVIDLPPPAVHYLVQVMRRSSGDTVRLFDNQTGEWLARLAAVGKKRATDVIEERLSEREDVPDLRLCGAPIKKGRGDGVAEEGGGGGG